MRAYRRAEYAVQAPTDNLLGTDGINVYYFDRRIQTIVAFKKENGYAPMAFNWRQDNVRPGVRLSARYVDGYVYIVSIFFTQDTDISLYRDGKLLKCISIHGILTADVAIFGQDEYYISLICVAMTTTYIDEYIVEDDDIKVKRCAITKNQHFNAITFMETNDYVYIYDNTNCKITRIKSIDNLVQFIGIHNTFPELLSQDTRYISLYNHEKRHKAIYCLKSSRSVITGEKTSHTCSVIGTIDDYVYKHSTVGWVSSKMVESIYLSRNDIEYVAQLNHDNCYGCVRYINTIGGMIYTAYDNKLVLYNTRWLWRDFALQDDDVKEIAITAALVLRRTCEHIVGRRIIHKIVRMVMEG